MARTEVIGGINFTWYESKRQVQRCLIYGTKDLMEAAGLLDRCNEFSDNKHGRSNAGFRTTWEDGDKIAKKLRSKQPKPARTMREWRGQQQADFLRRWLRYMEEWPNYALRRSIFLDIGMTREEYKYMTHVMFLDGWIDAESRLTERARKEVREWGDMQAVLDAE